MLMDIVGAKALGDYRLHLRFEVGVEGVVDLGPHLNAAARLADALRGELVRKRESFVFETVFSDPVGEKLAFLKTAAQAGYTTVLCYIGISGLDVSGQRVAMRVSPGR